MSGTTPTGRIVPAVHGRREARQDPDFELGLAESLKESYGLGGLIELYARFATSDGPLDGLMRRCIWRAAARRCGHEAFLRQSAAEAHVREKSLMNQKLRSTESQPSCRRRGRLDVYRTISRASLHAAPALCLAVNMKLRCRDSCISAAFSRSMSRFAA